MKQPTVVAAPDYAKLLDYSPPVKNYFSIADFLYGQTPEPPAGTKIVWCYGPVGSCSGGLVISPNDPVFYKYPTTTNKPIPQGPPPEEENPPEGTVPIPGTLALCLVGLGMMGGFKKIYRKICGFINFTK